MDKLIGSDTFCKDGRGESLKVEDKMGVNERKAVKKKLTFSDEFLKDEVREGFLIEKKMKCAWAAQLEVLQEIDRLCRKNGIQYFADSGTLLGAVRHKGFIPWDDDIDIAMKRDDYRSFFAVAEKELPEGWIFNDGFSHGQGYGRVVTGDMHDIGTERLLRLHGCPYVVGVDIFPLDHVPQVEEEEKAWHLLLEYLWILYNDLKKGEQCLADSGFEQNLRQAEEWCRVKFDRKGNLETQLMRLMNLIAESYGEEEAEELEMVVCDWGSEHRYKYRCEWYGDSIYVPFENIAVPIPIKYNEVLISLYGEDYMIPKRDVGYHDYPFYKKQDMLLEQLYKEGNK